METNNWNKEKQFWDFLYTLEEDWHDVLWTLHDSWFLHCFKNMDHDGTCIIIVSNHLTSTFTTSNSQILFVCGSNNIKSGVFSIDPHSCFSSNWFGSELKLIWTEHRSFHFLLKTLSLLMNSTRFELLIYKHCTNDMPHNSCFESTIQISSMSQTQL